MKDAPRPDRASHIGESITAARRRAILASAEAAGLLGGETGRIGARIRRGLLQAAKQRSGISSDTELLEYALAQVALEDDFAETLLSLKGAVPADLDLEF